MIHQPPRALKRALIAVAMAVTLALAACTGGSDDGDDVDPVAAGVAACVAGEPAADPEQPPDEITYLTGFFTLGREGYVYVADELGFFAAQNLAVTIEPGEPAVNTGAILSGQAQFAAVDPNGTLIRHGLGTEDDTVIVSAVQQLSTISLITLDITEPYELEGATIGAAPDGITETLFPAYARLAGIDAELVSWEYMDVPQQAPALAAGRVDAVAQFLMSQPTITTAAAAAGLDVEAKILPASDFLTDLFGTVHITTRRLAEDDPDLVRRFNAAILGGLECAIADPQQAGRIAAEAVEGANPEDVAAELEVMAPYVRGQLQDDEPTGAMAEDKVMRGIAVLEQLGQIPGGLQPDDVVAFDVVPGGGAWR